MKIRMNSAPVTAMLAALLLMIAAPAWCQSQSQDKNAQQPPPPAQSQPPQPPQAQKPPEQKAEDVQLEPESLAEASRKAKANKPKTDTKKVYTTDDISSSRGSAEAPAAGEKTSSAGSGSDAAGKALARAGGATGGSGGAGGSSGAAGAGAAKGEAYWRTRAQSLRQQMAQVDAEIAKVQDEIKRGGNAGFNVQSGLKTDTVYFEDRDTKLKRLEKQKADLQKQIDDFEDEARKADVPSGWIH